MAGTPTDERDELIGRNLQRLRRAAGLTQKQVGEIIDVSATQVQKYERGSNHFSARHAFTLSRHFGVPVSAFFDGIDVPAGGYLAETTQAGYCADDPVADLASAFGRVVGGFDRGGQERFRDFIKHLERQLRG